MTAFTVWLQDELNQREWSQSDLARKAEVNSGTISNLLNEFRKPGDDVCRAIAQALGIPQWYVFLQAGLLTEKPREMSDMNYKVARLAADLNSLTDEQLEQVLPLYENILKLAKK